MTAFHPADPPRPRLHRRWVLGVVAGSIAFGSLAIGVAWSEPLIHFDATVAATLHGNASQSPSTVRVMLAITRLGTFPAFVVLAVLVVAVFAYFRQVRLGLLWLATLIGGGVWVDGLKNAFDRPRPPYNTRFTTETSFSFPSGHAASSAVAYGMLAYCLALHWRGRRQRLALVVGFGCFVLLIGFTRLYLGVHYLSDVLAGYALALAWVSLCVCVIEVLRVRRHRTALAKTVVSEPSPSPARSGLDVET